MADLTALVQGREGREINVPKASDSIFNVNFTVPSTGAPHALSTATVDAVVYNRGDRKDTVAVATIALAIVTAIDGKCTLTFTAANSNITPGRYYMFLRRTLAGNIQFARKYTILNIT